MIQRDVIPLTDSFGREHTYLRISVTDRCNLRCRYCMPPQGFDRMEKEHILSFDEIHRVCRICAGMGISRIRITGGEPLVRKDLDRLIASIASVPGVETIGMTTNGVLLSPQISRLKEAGLTRLNISLDTLRRERFARIALRQHFDDVMTGIHASLDAGFAPVKLNVVVMRGVNDDELSDFVSFANDKPLHVRFIEYMPFKFNQWQSGGFVPFREMKERIDARFNLVPLSRMPGETVSRNYLIDGGPGRIGFITSMSCDFCDACNRLRLLADGSVKSCLFHPSEANIRESLRNGSSDDDIASMIRWAVVRKQQRHQPMELLTRIGNRSMIQIGG